MTHETAINKIKEPFQEAQEFTLTTRNSRQNLEEIGKTVSNIEQTQELFDRKKAFEELQYSPGIKRIYAVVQYATGNPLPKESWNELFDMQIEHVSELNGSLRQIIKGAETYANNLSRKLNCNSDMSKVALIKYNAIEDKIQSCEKRLDAVSTELEKYEERNPKRFDVLKEKNEAQKDLYRTLSETGLLKKIYSNFQRRGSFLEVHRMFQEGIIDSAKNLSVNTSAICEEIRQLNDAYKEIEPMGQAMSKIQHGLEKLKGHTNQLLGTYTSTYNECKNIEYTSRDSPLMQTGHVDNIVVTMCESLQERLTDETNTHTT